LRPRRRAQEQGERNGTCRSPRRGGVRSARDCRGAPSRSNVFCGIRLAHDACTRPTIAAKAKERTDVAANATCIGRLSFGFVASRPPATVGETATAVQLSSRNHEDSMRHGIRFHRRSMTRPRIVDPGITLALSRRTTRRHFLLHPDEARQMEQVYWYCLAYAANLHGVLIHAACLMSTHCHEVITDVRGEYPRFLQTLPVSALRSGCATSNIRLGTRRSAAAGRLSGRGVS
jgi:hypothetical protein